MKQIDKIKLENFKRFKSFEVSFNEGLNLLIGDNESGKSTILLALDLVLSGSKNKVENIGLESLFNTDVIKSFLDSPAPRKYSDLPKLVIELYLNEQNNPELYGAVNSDGVQVDGIRMICEPNDELGSEIVETIKDINSLFPFEFYTVRFETFAGNSYSGYRRFLRHIAIDNAQMGSEYAMREYIRSFYENAIETNTERCIYQHQYRAHKDAFKKSVLLDLNNKMSGCSFAIRTGPKSNLETDLAIFDGDISIENKGKGRQCFVKTQLALKKGISSLDIILIEEPENHLSHLNTNKLIHEIAGAKDKQVFVSTHSNLISTRLDLRKTILLNSNSDKPLRLDHLSEDTAEFFIKAPDNNILEFILSKKVILVEGDAEYMLLGAFYEMIAGKGIEEGEVHIISVDGTSFKRYLEIAKIIGIKTAVIRDNDGNYKTKCVDSFSEYDNCEDIQIFSESDNSLYTFEVSLYENNKTYCDDLFGGSRRTLTVQEYMLSNKTDVALKILESITQTFNVPEYIKNAVIWIKE